MKLIAAVDKNWGIGRANQLLVNIPSDKRYFKQLTEKNVVIMGRKTYESLPGKRALENRVNILLSTTLKEQPKGFVLVRTLEELLSLLPNYEGKEIFVTGGQMIYETLLPYCEEAYITKIDYAYHADRFCPNLDQKEGWILTGVTEEETYYDLEYYFCKYKNEKYEGTNKKW